MSDALELFRAMRPTAPGADAEDIRQPAGRSVPTVGGSVDLHNLAMVPGSPAYNARIPKPSCWQCGEDHFPGRGYDHEWTPEPPPLVHDEPVSATAINRRPTLEVQPSPIAAGKRLALYVGRGDTYVVAIEEAPDWDTVQSFKVEPHQVLPLVNIARALGAKVADKTGGDLVMLEEEDASQYAQDHGRGPTSVRDTEPRRPGPAADGPQESPPEPAELEDGKLPGGSSERRSSPRRAQR